VQYNRSGVNGLSLCTIDPYLFSNSGGNRESAASKMGGLFCIENDVNVGSVIDRTAATFRPNGLRFEPLKN
jgi:hypothetical protein